MNDTPAPTPPASGSRVALAVVVTQQALAEFLVLKRSFELFHGDRFEWFIRCDEPSHATLAALPQTRCVVFPADPSYSLQRRSDDGWLALVSQKRHAMEDAWSSGRCDAVLYLDTDLVVVAPFIERLWALGGQVVLTPHYFRPHRQHDLRVNGYYNSGFIFARDRTFHHWWRDAVARHRSDQRCLDGAHASFDIRALPEAANVGWWRGDDHWDLPTLPPDCLFFHVHLFQEARHAHELSQKTFALNCLEFLLEQQTPEHLQLAEEILTLDRAGYYRALLRRRVAVVTACEARRAVRLLLMARTLPRQVELLCRGDGPLDGFDRRLAQAGDVALPPNVRVLLDGSTRDRRDWLAQAARPVDFVFAVDIDFVFPLAFWYRFWQVAQAGQVPMAMRDPDGRFLQGTPPPRSDILDSETLDTHHLPLLATDLSRAEPFDPAPGVLLDADAFLTHRPLDATVPLTSGPSIFHLWHPADQESPCAGWLLR